MREVVKPRFEAGKPQVPFLEQRFLQTLAGGLLNHCFEATVPSFLKKVSEYKPRHHPVGTFVLDLGERTIDITTWLACFYGTSCITSLRFVCHISWQLRHGSNGNTCRSIAAPACPNPGDASRDALAVSARPSSDEVQQKIALAPKLTQRLRCIHI